MEHPSEFRYRSIIEDWEAFQRAAEMPMPYVVRANTLKIESPVLYTRLLDAGIDVIPYEWNGDLFELAEPPGRRIEHWLGFYYAQEAVQTLPVMALDPQPGETALDLCAAPGGTNINRLGVLNTMVTAYQGENFPMQTSFDRILVDAPCSAEGTLRKEPSLRNGASSGTIARLARLQKRLILRAFDLLAAGGLLVYSTCTFAPEENEAVVAHLLQERDAQIIPFNSPIEASSGLLGWHGETFPEQTKHCVRVYPHHLNSGGGFLARITRA